MSNHEAISIYFYLGFDKFDLVNDQEDSNCFRETLRKKPSGMYEFRPQGQEKPTVEKAIDELAKRLKSGGVQGQVFWKLFNEAEIQENSQFTLTNTYERKTHCEEYITFPYYLDLDKADAGNTSLARILQKKPSGEFRVETELIARIDDIEWDIEATQKFWQGIEILKIALKKAGVRGTVLIGGGDWSKTSSITWTGTVQVPNIQNPFVID